MSEQNTQPAASDEREALVQRLRDAAEVWAGNKAWTEIAPLLDEAADALAQPVLVAVPEGLLTAALRWVYCPPQGGYKNGASVEDCCEALTDEVVKLTGVRPGDEWISESEIPQLAASPQPAQQPHPDDIAVDAFAAAMKEKLAAARAKGRAGWQTCEPWALSEMLRDHVEKGDPRDVANFCMFLWSIGSPITLPVPGSEAFDRWASRGMGRVAPQPERPRVYSLDKDPEGIRARVCGAIAWGAQNTNPPPDGHWLGEFWRMARAEREAATPPAAAEPPAASTYTTEHMHAAWYAIGADVAGLRWTDFVDALAKFGGRNG
jgi:hypothetical protein